MKKNLLRNFAILLLFLFAVFTFFVHLGVFRPLDLGVTEFLQDNLSRSLDVPFSLFSLLGSFEIVILILLLCKAIYNKLNYFYVLFFFGIFHLLEFVGKAFVNHPGPISKFFRYDIPFVFPSSSVNPGSSYPSGHLGRTLFLSAILFFIVSKNKKLSSFQKKSIYILLIIFDLIMFVSRIYLGEHWLSDVVGGSILGAALGFASLLFL